MSLNDTVFAGVETAFSAAGSFVSLASYVVRTGTPVYNPLTDLQEVPTTTFSPVRMIRSTMTSEEREASPVTVEDVKVLVPSVDLPGVRPDETDTFTLDGAGYNLLTWRTVPGGSLYIMFGRRQ